MRSVGLPDKIRFVEPPGGLPSGLGKPVASSSLTTSVPPDKIVLPVNVLFSAEMVSVPEFVYVKPAAPMMPPLPVSV